MKITKIIALLLAAVVLSLSLASMAAAESTPYEEAVRKYEEMKQETVKVSLAFDGLYSVKESKFYARQVTGVNPDGSFQLGSWVLINYTTGIGPASEYSFSLSGTYIHFAYSFDVTWGTDWPYSGVFWTCPNGDTAKKIEIYCAGLARNVEFYLEVNDHPVVFDKNCSSHSQWKP